jgi:protein ImuB
MSKNEPSAEGLAQLIDRLRHRLGPRAVARFHTRESHIPERAEELRTADAAALHSEAEKSGPHAPALARPILLLSPPEPAEVMAPVPDGPPLRFRWRGVVHQVAEAEGPERIAPEWWRRTTEAERDYFIVEDSAGCRFWLFRHGLYGHGDTIPQWFVHGVFG